MALGDLMTSQFSQFSLAVSNHVIDGNVSSGGYHDDDVAYADLMSQRRDLDAASTSSYAIGVTSTATEPTTMAYLPQTVVLCKLRHAAFEASTPTGPFDSGLVSKWRPKYRMKTGCVALVSCLNISVDPPDVIKISPCARMECWTGMFFESILSYFCIFARAVAPTGHVYTFDFHEQRAASAREDFERTGISTLVTVGVRGIQGFPDQFSGLADSIFLDLPQPWLAIPSA